MKTINKYVKQSKGTFKSSLGIVMVIIFEIKLLCLLGFICFPFKSCSYHSLMYSVSFQDCKIHYVVFIYINIYLYIFIYIFIYIAQGSLLSHPLVEKCNFDEKVFFFFFLR